MHNGQFEPKYYSFIDMEVIFTCLFEGATSNRVELRLQMISKIYFTMIVNLYIVIYIPYEHSREGTF
jgi:hypothetical protein